MKKLFVVLAAMLLLAVMACSSKSDDVSSKDIGQAGETLVSSDGNATLNVPSGALNNTVSLTIQKATLSDNIGPTGQPYVFGPDGTQFNIPAHVKITYDPSSLPAGINEADLVLVSRQLSSVG